MSVDNAYEILFSSCLIVIVVCLVMVILKSILGPRISDRLMMINMVGTLVTSAIAILSVFIPGASYLVDICIIYVLISFLSVIVFTNVFINAYLRNKKDGKKGNKSEEVQK